MQHHTILHKLYIDFSNTSVLNINMHIFDLNNLEMLLYSYNIYFLFRGYNESNISNQQLRLLQKNKQR